MAYCVPKLVLIYIFIASRVNVNLTIQRIFTFSRIVFHWELIVI